MVVELTAPRSTAGAIRYTARVLDAGAGVFARYGSDGQVPGTFGTASLFIDSSGDALFQPVTLQVSNAGPGQRISIEVGSAGAAAVGWSMGPSFQDSAGGGGSSALTTIQLYLAAEAGIETFYLRASADPSIEVTAAIGSAPPQALDQTQTTFNWPRSDRPVVRHPPGPRCVWCSGADPHVSLHDSTNSTQQRCRQLA